MSPPEPPLTRADARAVHHHLHDTTRYAVAGVRGSRGGMTTEEALRAEVRRYRGALATIAATKADCLCGRCNACLARDTLEGRA